MQGIVLVNQRYRNFPIATYMFEDTIFNTPNTTPTDTGVAITPDNGKNLVFARSSCSAGSEGVDLGTMRATYDGTEIGTAMPFLSDQGDHWNANDFGMMKLVDASGAAEVKLQAHTTAGGRSIDVGTQQLLTIPLETMGLVEGVDYWYQEEHEVTPVVWKAGDTDVAPYAPSSVDLNIREISRLDWTAPETEVYITFFSFESDMFRPVSEANHAIYLVTSWDQKSAAIERSGTTATVTTTEDHAYSTNQWVTIAGADQTEYNAEYNQITVTGVKTFTYQVSGSPDSPATGTITSQKASISTDGQNNHMGMEGAGGTSYQAYCWVGSAPVTAGSAFAAITGQVWQGTGDISVRRCRMCVIRASSLTAGQQQATHSDTGGGHWSPYEAYGNGDEFATIEAVSGRATMTQTYTPPGPAQEQTVVFACLISQDSTDITPPRSNMTYVLRDDTAGVNFAEDMGRPLPKTGSVTWTFGMGVRDNNDSSSTWKVQAREANDTGNDVKFRRGFVVIVGLKYV